MGDMFIRDGFLGQRLRTLPKPLVMKALTRPLTSRLLVTDAGHFPHATAHGRIRVRGAAEAIVILCTDGCGRLEMLGEVREVEAGHAVIIPRNTPHKYMADDGDPWTIWWMHVDGADVDELVESLVDVRGWSTLDVRDIYTAVGLIEQAVKNLERDETNATLFACAGVAWNLLAQLASDRLRGHPDTTDRIHLVQDYLRQHLDTPTTVSELAKLAGLSTSHFSALFKASAGIGVVEFLKRLRSARARELLITTDTSIRDIARTVGYEDAFYFSRQFRVINGVSPSQYRAIAHREAL